MSKTTFLVLLVVLLGGCEWIDDVGRHMPVLGERCENWQCFTESGQAKSEAKKRTIAGHVEKADSSGRKSLNTDTTSAQLPSAASSSVAPADSEPVTPFDMTPEQLNGY